MGSKKTLFDSSCAVAKEEKGSSCGWIWSCAVVLHYMAASKQEYARYQGIDVEARGYSCSSFMQNRLACGHPVAVLHDNSSTIDISAEFHPSYLVKHFERVFLTRSIELFVSTRTPLVMNNPRPFYKRTGRRQIRRISRSGYSKSGLTYKCRYCF